MVFQSYALYPHMTVYNNLAFGLRNRRFPKEVEERVRARREMLDLTPLLNASRSSSPAGSASASRSGRAIVREPAAFLMDEPLSNLDASCACRPVRRSCKLQRGLGTTTVYVTHDQVEAMTMGDRIAVMSLGVLQQVGSPQELYERPSERLRRRVHRLAGDEPRSRSAGRRRRSNLIAGFRPEHLRVDGAGGSEISFGAKVEVIEYLGNEKLVHASREGTPLTALVPVEEAVSEGEDVTFEVRPDKLHLFDAETEQVVR